MAKAPLNLGNVISQNIVNTEENTSAKRMEVTSDSKALSIKIDGTRYNLLRKASFVTKKTHRQIMLEGFDLWMETYGKEE